MRKKARAIGDIVQKGLDSSIERARQKGQERLTIMMIPHGQEKIFSLQLNYQMIFFLLGILVLAVSLAFYGLYRKSLKTAESDKLRDRYGLNFRSAMTLREVSGEILEDNLALYNNLKEISLLAGVPEEEIQELPDTDESATRARRELDREAIAGSRLGPGRNFLPPVYSLRSLSFAMHDQFRALEAVERIVGRGLGSYSVMPIGRAFNPNQMGALRDTSGFGMRVDPFSLAGFEVHLGQDTAGPDGTPVRCTGVGTVEQAVYDGGYGNHVVVRHQNGFFSMYAHLNKILVNAGDKVVRGQVIGLMGRTGRATGSHLHYEVWLGEQNRIDPVPYMCALDFKTDLCRNL